MKVSLKRQDHHQQTHSHDDDKSHHLQPPALLLRAKIPVTIFNLPFLSHFSTTTTRPSDLSLSLSTNSPSFPSLKLSYAASTAAAATPPFSLTLKSGTGLFGSPHNSPLVISARFSFNHSNPTFSLFLKPQLGSFSLRKSVSSHRDPTIGSDPGSNSNSLGLVPVESHAIVKDLSTLETENGDGGVSIIKGIQLAARTQVPVSKRVGLDFRWWVNFAEGNRMPVLRINKIEVGRVCDDVLVGEEDEKSKERRDQGGEEEVMKGMCFWMKKELDALSRVNREMKCELEEMKAGHLARNDVERPNNGSGGFEKWRNSKRKGEEINGKKEERKNGVGSVAAVDLENELERAIKATAAAAASCSS